MAVTKLGVYREALRLIGEHDIASTSVDEEPRYVLDAAYDNAVLYCLSLGWWRFAFHTESAATTASGSSGFSYRISLPNNWLRTHSVGVLNGTRFLPTDWHEFTSSSYIYVKYATVYINYISRETSETLWPEVFGKLVAAYLAFECCERISQSRATKGDLAKIMDDRLALARVSESLPPPLVLPQHAVEKTTRALLEQGFWRFSVVTGAPSGTTSPATGYSNAFTLPADYMRVYDVMVESSGALRPIDWRIEGTKLSAKSSSVRLQYVSSNYVDPTTWPQAFADAVMMALNIESASVTGAAPDKIEPLRAQLDKAIDAALAKDGLPRPLSLPEHAVETSARELLEQGYWVFSLKNTSPSTTTGPIAGYSQAFTLPTDYLRAYGVVVESSGKLRPVDWKIEGSKLSAKASAVRLEYVSSDFLVPSTWTEAFAQAVDLYLDVKAMLAMGPDMAAKAADARAALDKITDAALGKDRRPRPLDLPEHAVETSARELLEQGFWVFSIKSTSPSTTTGPITGYSQAFTLPADYLRAYDVMVASSGKLRPVDWRIEGAKLSAKASAVRLEYVSSDFLVPSTWTEGFAQALGAALLLKSVLYASPQAAAQAAEARAAFDKMTDSALSKDGRPRPSRLPEHAVERSARSLLEQGFWRFSIKTVTPSSTTGPASGYASAYTLPADHLRTYDVTLLANSRLYVIDRQEEGGKLSVQHASNVRLRYVSSDFISPFTWPEAFADAVSVCLSIEALRADDPGADVKVPRAQLEKMLDSSLGKDRLPRPLLLQPGAVDRLIRAQLEDGIWRFASETHSLSGVSDVDIAPGYLYAFQIPSDLARIIRVFRMEGSTERDIDYRYDSSNTDETIPVGELQSHLYANYDPIKVRYVSKDGVNPAYWTELFAAAFDAGLRYESAMAENLPEGEVHARMQTWRALLKQAKIKDGLNERPKIHTGLWNRSRGGYSNREQGR